MRRILLAAAALLPVAAVIAQAQSRDDQAASDSCLQWKAALSAAQASSPGAELVRTLQGRLAQDFVGIVNRLPPVSSFDGDRVALFFRKADDLFLVVIGRNQCARHVVELPASVFARMLGQEA
jgi:hypothetical protein